MQEKMKYKKTTRKREIEKLFDKQTYSHKIFCKWDTGLSLASLNKKAVRSYKITWWKKKDLEESQNFQIKQLDLV